jgi:basic membrane protein A
MRHLRAVIALSLALLLVATACSDDDSTDSEPTTTATSTDTAATSTTASDVVVDLDADGDGSITIGIAAQGPRDDGGYYEAVVAEAERLSDENGFETPIVVDNVETTSAEQELRNLADQGVDIIFVGASGIAEPMPALAEEYEEIFWYCNCGSGFTESEFYAQSGDDSSEISFTAGYATGLLLQASGGESAHFLGCCDLAFEKESFLAFELGLAKVDDSFEATYVPTGDFQYDFDNVVNATAAFDNAVAAGADAVYPFLSGAHEPVVALANAEGSIVMSAGASDACERDDLDYDIAVAFDGGDYIRALFPLIVSGEFTEGQTKTFHVGVDPEPGARICDPTPEQTTEMEAAFADVAAGTFSDAFDKIKGKAYSG